MKNRFIFTLLSCILFTQLTQPMEFGFSTEEKDESESTDLISLDTSAISHRLISLYESIKDYFKDKKLNDELIEAVRQRNFEKVKQLIEKGANVNYQDKYKYTPLLYACYSCRKEKINKKLIKFLLQNGADANYKNCRHITPLFNLIGSYLDLDIYLNSDENKKNKIIETIKFLIERGGANVNYEELNYATSYKLKRIVQLLLQYNVNIKYSFDFSEEELTNKFIELYCPYKTFKDNNPNLKHSDFSDYKKFNKLSKLIKNKEEELRKKYQNYLIKRLLLRLKIIFEKTVQDNNNNNQVSKIPKEIYNKEVASYFNAQEIEKLFDTNFEHWYKNTLKK